MNKSVLLSIKPKYCELIASGKKTVEIRKNRPKIDVPFKCYIYCTLNGTTEIPMEEYFAGKWHKKKGKVIGEFICDLVTPINHHDIITGCSERGEFELQDATGLNIYELLYCLDYRSIIWGWHISDLVIYDKPKELSEFSLTRPPQSWCYVEELSSLS